MVKGAESVTKVVSRNSTAPEVASNVLTVWKTEEYPIPSSNTDLFRVCDVFIVSTMDNPGYVIDCEHSDFGEFFKNLSRNKPTHDFFFKCSEKVKVQLVHPISCGYYI